MTFEQLPKVMRQYFANASSRRRFFVFVIEDLDKLAEHPKQTILYGLSELALEMPVIVLGISSKNVIFS